MINTILAAVAAIGLWFLYYYGWRPYRLDKTRQDLFTLRDNLFLYWHENGLSHDDEAYMIMRQSINGMLRFTHRISALTVAALVYTDKVRFNSASGKEFENRFDRAISSLPKPARKKIRETRYQMHRVLLEHVVFSSLPWMLVFWVGFVFNITKVMGRRLLMSKNKWSSLDAELFKDDSLLQP